MGKDKVVSLGDAYALETPADSVRLYRDWANTYDESFATQRGYCYPESLATVFADRAEADDTPVLDVGAGTGLVAQALCAKTDAVVDGVDISAEMLQVSKQKGLYRQLFQEDLSARLSIADEQYGAVVSAGTFTHGHVGPAALTELLRIARSGALFCLGINGTAFDKYGFGSAFAALSAAGDVSPLEFVSSRYYDRADDKNADDIAYTVIFRKTSS